MTNPVPYPPAPAPAPQAPLPPRNGLGTTGFVLGLVGLVFSPIPFVGVVAWPLVILGLIFSAVGFARTRSGAATNKGLSIAGMVVSVVGLIVCIIWVAVIGKAASDVNDEINRAANVTYELTGDATNVEVQYGDVSNPITETVPSLPWSKQMQNTGVYKSGTMNVTTGEGGGSVTCKLTVDGQVVSTDTVSGAYEVAFCLGG